MGVNLDRGDVIWFDMDVIRREFGGRSAKVPPVVVSKPWTCQTVAVGTVTIPIEEAIGRGIVRVARGQDIITDPTGMPALGLTDDPLAALRECLAFSSRDWAREADLAWLYGIVLGWDDHEEPDEDAMSEVAARFGWDAAKVARLRALRGAFASLDAGKEIPGPVMNAEALRRANELVDIGDDWTPDDVELAGRALSKGYVDAWQAYRLGVYHGLLDALGGGA